MNIIEVSVLDQNRTAGKILEDINRGQFGVERDKEGSENSWHFGCAYDFLIENKLKKKDIDKVHMKQMLYVNLSNYITDLFIRVRSHQICFDYSNKNLKFKILI